MLRPKKHCQKNFWPFNFFATRGGGKIWTFILHPNRNFNRFANRHYILYSPLPCILERLPFEKPLFFVTNSSLSKTLINFFFIFMSNHSTKYTTRQCDGRCCGRVEKKNQQTSGAKKNFFLQLMRGHCQRQFFLVALDLL